MAFSNDIQEDAFDRQGERCAYCGKRLVWGNNQQGMCGAWNAHHKKATMHGGGDTLGNCAIFVPILDTNSQE